ncbi:radical SAM/SPASM domain-containing protein [Candidatus Micrarchaeota archaeon]|nr:MAG: radical SAM/SPASM domain-containing protein [Candidatus Micrarchaeota archaeon]
MTEYDKTSDAIVALKEIFENPLVRLILKYFISKERLDRALEIYCGLDKPHNVSEEINAFLVSYAVNKGAAVFGKKRQDFIEYFKNPVPRRGLNLVLRSIVEYGITKPQKLVAPFLVVWDSTLMCNLRCKHCYASAGVSTPPPDELNTEQRKQVIDQLDEAGVVAIAFSGGEPLMRPDFFEIAKYAHEKGMFISVASNGTLITKQIAKKLKQVGVGYIEISLDHSSPKIHDEFRGVKGAWKRAVQGIKNCVEAGLFTCIATTATQHNYDDIPKMIKLAKKLKANRFVVFNFIPTGRGNEIKKWDLTPQQREDLMNLLYDELEKEGGMQSFSTCPAYARISMERVMAGKGKTVAPTHFAGASLHGKAIAIAEFIGGCGAGRNYCSIEYNGDMQPCVFIPITIGNVLKDGFENVWKNSELLNKMRNRELLKDGCGECPYKYICGGCRARAYACTGDIMASDPGCLFVKKFEEEHQPENQAMQIFWL